MKKLILSVLLTAALLSFASCGKEDKQPQDSTASDTVTEKTAAPSAQQITEMLKESGKLPAADAAIAYGDETFDSYCEKLYGTALSELSDGAIMYVSSGEFADEVSVISLNPESSVDVLSVLEQRKETRYNDFEGYNPDELDKISKAEIFRTNGFGVLIISDNSSEIKTLIEDFTK